MPAFTPLDADTHKALELPARLGNWQCRPELQNASETRRRVVHLNVAFADRKRQSLAGSQDALMRSDQFFGEWALDGANERDPDKCVPGNALQWWPWNCERSFRRL